MVELGDGELSPLLRLAGDEAVLNTTLRAPLRAGFAAAPTLAPSAAGYELAVGDGARARSRSPRAHDSAPT
ncbi:MAG: hypothetical protein IPK80_21335 [Nannocystis sp.]|nr:hypothetical protein [Nannocystis sp.]